MISQSLLVQGNPTFPLLTLQALRHSIVGAGGKVSEAVRRNVLETTERFAYMNRAYIDKWSVEVRPSSFRKMQTMPAKFKVSNYFIFEK